MFNRKSKDSGQRFGPGAYGQGQMPPGAFGYGPGPTPQGPTPQGPTAYGQGPAPTQNPYVSPNQSGLYPNIQMERLYFEIRENRRRINNLLKRVIRIENYLRIRDTSDMAIPDEEQHIPNEFSM